MPVADSNMINGDNPNGNNPNPGNIRPAELGARSSSQTDFAQGGVPTAPGQPGPIQQQYPAQPSFGASGRPPPPPNNSNNFMARPGTMRPPPPTMRPPMPYTSQQPPQQFQPQSQQQFQPPPQQQQFQPQSQQQQFQPPPQQPFIRPPLPQASSSTTSTPYAGSVYQPNTGFSPHGSQSNIGSKENLAMEAAESGSFSSKTNGNPVPGYPPPTNAPPMTQNQKRRVYPEEINRAYSGSPAAAASNALSGSMSNPQVNTLANQFQTMNVSSQQPASPVIPLLGAPPYVFDLKTEPAPPLFQQTSSYSSGPGPVSPPQNCPGSFQRCTLGAIPQNSTLLAKSKLLLGLILSPFHKPHSTDPAIPLIEKGVIVRCRRCRTYINPFVQFVDQGARWRCNMCDLTNDVPSQFDYDSVKQEYTERALKPELNCAVVEYIAPSEYMVRPPQPPVYLFLIDVSFPSIQSGMLQVTAKAILDYLDQIPNTDDRTQIGFITYDQQIHFYNLNEKLTDPQMLVVSDLIDIFLPRPADLLVNLTDSKPVIRSLLEKLGTYFQGNQAPASAFGSALKYAQQLISAIGGKIVSFVSSIPSVGEGILKPKDEMKLLGTPKENSLLQASSPFYKNFAIECSRNQVSLDLFVFTSQNIDLATLSGAVRYTGGNIFYYPKFNASIPEETFHFERDLGAFLSRPVGFEAVLRIRASKGLQLSAYHGNFFLRSSDLLSLPNVSPENSYAVQLTIEENLAGPYAVFQTALLHTSCFGQRRIRVITSVVPITSSFPELYDRIDQGALVTLLSKLAIERALTSKLEDARDALVNKCIDILATYKAQVAPSAVTQVTQLNVCDPLKQFPLLVLSMLKHPFIRFGSGSTIGSDQRIYSMFLMRNMYIDETLDYIHPNFYSLHNLPEQAGYPHRPDGASESSQSIIVLPPPLNLSSERLERHGLYLLDDGVEMLLWVGKAVSPALCANLFNRPSYESISPGKVILPDLDNPYSRQVRSILGQLTRQRTYSIPLSIVKEDVDPSLRMRFLWALVEDRVDSSLSYPQWLAHLRDKVNTYSG